MSAESVRDHVRRELLAAMRWIADQESASDEVRRAMRSRLIRLAIDPTDPEYNRRRAERTDMFVNIDLALLKIKADEAAGNGPSDY